MKKFLFVCGLILGLAGLSHAAPAPTYVYETAIDTMTVVRISVSTSAATQMDNPALVTRAAMEIQNLDSSNSIWCAPRSNVAVATGRKIPAGGSWVLGLQTYLQPNGTVPATKTATHIYCISDGVAASAASVTQMN